MLDCGKVTDTIYKRSVRKVIERKVSGAVSQGDAIRDISHFKSKSGNPIAAATAVPSVFGQYTDHCAGGSFGEIHQRTGGSSG